MVLEQPKVFPDRKIITILGSTKFRKEITELAWEYTKQGFLVLFAWEYKESDLLKILTKEKLDGLNNLKNELEIQDFQKVRMAHIILVFNKSGIGNSTYTEIGYSIRLNKLVAFLEKIPTEYEKYKKLIWNWEYYCKYCKDCPEEIYLPDCDQAFPCLIHNIMDENSFDEEDN